MIEESIVSKINEKFKPAVLFVENESHMHSGLRTESHFKVYLVSNIFENLSKLDRQREVSSILKEEFDQGLHALSLRLRTPSEHNEKGADNFVSPSCVSKNKGGI